MQDFLGFSKSLGRKNVQPRYKAYGPSNSNKAQKLTGHAPLRCPLGLENSSFNFHSRFLA